MHLFIHIPILSLKLLSVGSRLSKCPYTGFGKNHRKRWLSPFSAFPGSSMSDLATHGWVKPPTVRLVLLIEKLASPVTEFMKPRHKLTL